MTSEELKALAEQYKRAQQSGDTVITDMARSAVMALARAEGARNEARVLASFINDA